MKIKWTSPPARRPLNQYSLGELYDNRSPNFLHHDERVAELREPQIMKAFANTLILRTPSSKFSQNGAFWHQYIMFEDFIQLAKDRDIPLRDAVEFAITDCDVHVHCSCPAQLYWGYKYISTQLGYNYAGYRESRRPDENNPRLLGTTCLVADTPVWTERGLVPIQDVQIGDKVYTHKGRLCRVVYTSSRDADDLYEVKVGSERFRITSEHPWLSLRGRYPLDVSKLSWDWHTTEEIATDTTSNHWFAAAPRLCPGTVSVPSKFAFLLGLFLSDGSLGWRSGHTKSKYPTIGDIAFRELRIYLHADYLDIYLERLSSFGYSNLKVQTRPGTKACCIRIRDPELLHFIMEYSTPTCYALNLEKSISDKVLSWDSDSIRQFLVGYFWGDGSLTCSAGSPNNGHYTIASIHTTSRQMADMLSILLRTQFWHPGLYCYSRKAAFSHVAPILNPKPMYLLRICGSQVEDFLSWDSVMSSLKGFTVKRRTFSNSSFVSLSDSWVRLISSTCPYSGVHTVYNIQVEGDESFLVGRQGLALHNCKHLSNATLWLMDNIDEVLDWFSVYYQSVVAEDSDPEEDIVSVSSPDSSDVIAETHVEDSSDSPSDGVVSDDSLAPSSLDNDGSILAPSSLDNDGSILVTEVYSVDDVVAGSEMIEPETEPDAGSEMIEPETEPDAGSGVVDVLAVFDDLDDYLDSYADLPDEEPEDD